MKSLVIVGTMLIGSHVYGSPILPDNNLTPGVIDPDATVEKLCLAGYTGTVRNVSNATKRKVFAEYNIDSKSDKYEIDHLISLEIGGSNDVANLWPQSYTMLPWNAHVKDKLENRLHRMICDRIVTIDDAQKKMSGDWIATYCSIYNDKKDDCDVYLKSIATVTK